MIQKNFGVFTTSAFLFLIVFSIPSLIASPENSNKPPLKSSSSQSEISNPPSVKSNPSNPQLDKTAFVQKTKKPQIPFIANNGQVDKQVKFYANTFGGTVFVTKDGEIVYALPASKSGKLRDKKSEARSQKIEVGIQNADARKQNKNLLTANSKPETQNLNPQSEIQGVALREEFVGAKIKTIQGGEKSVTNVNYFKGKDPSKWNTNISTYEAVSLGEVYDGIELKLKAYGNNVEKIFCVKPDANPDQIQVNLSGAKGLRVNDEGQLVAEIELGAVKFTKPVAYQEINGKRVDVECKYTIADCGMQNAECKTNLKSEIRNPKLEYGFTVASYDKTKDLIIDPLLASTFLGGYSSDYGYSMAIDSDGNIYVAGQTGSSDFPTTTGAYDTSYNNGDVFISRLDSDLTSLLASTYLGGSQGDYIYSIVIDSETGNIYVTGQTDSSDFPITRGTYDSYYNGGDNDAFVSKLSDDLSSLIASTYLGGSSDDYSRSIAIDVGGNVYISGYTSSSDFPITTGAYDTSVGGSTDVFISKINGDLTSLLASAYMGGSDYDFGYSMAIDSSGNIYMIGYTLSSDFPITTSAYNTSINNGDTFVSKINGDLTRLLASTYLGGSGNDYGKSLVIDSGGNIYVTGVTGSSDFPTTTGVYSPFYKGGDNDAFVSKLSVDLTSLLASTYLGGSSGDAAHSLAIDSDGNVCVTGETGSSNFPITTDAYDTSYKGGDNDAFVSKLSDNLSSLIASTYLGGSDSDSANAIIMGQNGNIYVTGSTYSSNFPTNIDVYDTSYGGSADVFVSKFDSNLSASPPTVTTVSVTNLTSTSATLNGTVNANGFSTTAWFEYSTTSKLYNITSPSQTVSGWEYNTVSNDISELSPGTTYYYRLVAQNSAGVTYGTEISFTTTRGKISGHVIDTKGSPIESVKLMLKGKKTKISKTAIADTDGLFEFTDLNADTYIITAIKKGYKIVKQTITLEAGEERDIEIVMKKTKRK